MRVKGNSCCLLINLPFLKTFLKILFLLLPVLPAFAQQTVVSGYVRDSISGEALPFASIIFSNSTIGITADSSGFYILESNKRFDSLSVSMIGYLSQTIAIKPFQSQQIDIRLVSYDYDLNEVVILPGENPAFEILRKVIAAKPKNNPEEYDAYQYEVYHKVQFDLNHFTEKTKRNLLLKPFDFIWENADTTDNGVTYLPLLFTESISDYYHLKTPDATKELVKGRRAVGLKGPKIVRFVEDMYVHPNVYENFVVILDKSFPSPINDRYKSNYRFYLEDSLFIDGMRCYKIRFVPKVKSDIAFRGEMFIHDTTFAVKQIDLEFSIEANVNYVRNYWIRQNYLPVDGKHWMITKSQVFADFTVVENQEDLAGFFGRNTSEFRSITVNQPRNEKFYKGIDKIIMDEGAEERDEHFWDLARRQTLTKEEKGIFNMIDTLESLPKFRALKNAVITIASGWLPWKSFDIGDIYSFYSYNNLEGSRFKLGFRNIRAFNGNLKLKAYASYGLKDERWKYLIEAEYFFDNKPNKRNMIGTSWKHDIEQPGRSINIIQLDHILSSLIRTQQLNNRLFVDEQNFYFERQWFTGFTTRAGVFRRNVAMMGANSFEFFQNDSSITATDYTAGGVKISVRFSKGDKKLSAKYGNGLKGVRVPEHPVVSAEYTLGIKGFADSDFDAQELKLRLEHTVRMNKLGFFLYRIEAGKIWGTLPYPFLQTPVANQLVLNDDVAFNLLNYLEFVSDQFVSMQVEHHFEGLLFNRLPLINKLKWREFIFGKMYYGTLSAANNQKVYIFPEITKTMNQPYYEVGFGIENIFKISRIDFTWRLNYLDKPGETIWYFMVKPSFYFKF